MSDSRDLHVDEIIGFGGVPRRPTVAASVAETAMANSKSVQTILAAVADAGASGQVAARKAAELAWLLGADVVLYHAGYDPALSGRPFFDTPGLAKARREYIAELAGRLERVAGNIAVPGVDVRCRVEWQRLIPDAVARAASRERAAFVVAEPRFRGLGRRLGLSHTDWELARLAPVPVLMCRSAAPYSQPTIIAAVDPGGHGLRPSTLDVGIVGLAALLAKATDGRAQLVHCFRDVGVRIAVRPEALRREKRRIRGLLRHLALGAGLKARDVRLVHGVPAEALLEAVTAGNADVLVLGSVVRGPLTRLLLGSTAERLIHLAPCDILLVKPGAIIRPPTIGRETGAGGFARRP